jgi:hypothetical protein
MAISRAHAPVCSDSGSQSPPHPPSPACSRRRLLNKYKCERYPDVRNNSLGSFLCTLCIVSCRALLASSRALLSLTLAQSVRPRFRRRGQKQTRLAS